MNEEQIEDMYYYHEAMSNSVQCPNCLSDIGISEITNHIKHCKEESK